MLAEIQRLVNWTYRSPGRSCSQEASEEALQYALDINNVEALKALVFEAGRLKAPATRDS